MARRSPLPRNKPLVTGGKSPGWRQREVCLPWPPGCWGQISETGSTELGQHFLWSPVVRAWGGHEWQIRGWAWQNQRGGVPEPGGEENFLWSLAQGISPPCQTQPAAVLCGLRRQKDLLKCHKSPNWGCSCLGPYDSLTGIFLVSAHPVSSKKCRLLLPGT